MSKEIEKAIDTLKEAMQEDEEYAWSWQCALAVMAMDAGASHKRANQRAAIFMQTFFDNYPVAPQFELVLNQIKPSCYRTLNLPLIVFDRFA